MPIVSHMITICESWQKFVVDIFAIPLLVILRAWIQRNTTFEWNTIDGDEWYYNTLVMLYGENWKYEICEANRKWWWPQRRRISFCPIFYIPSQTTIQCIFIIIYQYTFYFKHNFRFRYCPVSNVGRFGWLVGLVLSSSSISWYVVCPLPSSPYIYNIFLSLGVCKCRNTTKRNIIKAYLNLSIFIHESYPFCESWTV